jgi:hypothetical protein
MPMAIKSSVFSDQMPCNMMIDNRCFGRKFSLHLQDRILCPAIIQDEAGIYAIGTWLFRLKTPNFSGLSPTKRSNIRTYQVTVLDWYIGVRFPARSLHFSTDLILLNPTVALGPNQTVTEMSTRNLTGRGKARPAGKADNITATCETIV